MIVSSVVQQRDPVNFHLWHLFVIVHGWLIHINGSILNNRWILSDAHCTTIYSSNISNFVVVVGAHHFHNDGRIYHLDRIVDHPKYIGSNTDIRNSITLLRTNEMIQFNDQVKPIMLRRQFVDAGVTSTLIGWGLTHVRKQFLWFLKFHVHFSCTNVWRCEKVCSFYINLVLDFHPVWRLCAANAFAVLGCEYIDEWRLSEAFHRFMATVHLQRNTLRACTKRSRCLHVR